MIGLCVGGAYGLARLWIDSEGGYLGYFLTNTYAAYSYSMLITAASMVAVSLVLGWEKKGELRTVEADGWLGRSQEQARQLLASQPEDVSNSRLPAVLALLVLALGCILSFVIFW